MPTDARGAVTDGAEPLPARAVEPIRVDVGADCIRCRVGASIGAALAGDGEHLRAVLARADQAMRLARRADGGIGIDADGTPPPGAAGCKG